MRAYKVLPILAALVVSSAPAMAQEYLEPGAFVEQAAALDVTEAGLNGLIDLSLAGLPTELVVGSVPPQQVWDGFLCDLDVIIDNLIINNSIQEIVVESTSAGLFLQVRAELAINSEEDPAVVELDGCIDYICGLYSEPAEVTVSIPLSMAIATDPDTGEEFIDMTFGEFSHNIDVALENKVQLTDCAIGNINGWLSSTLGLNIFDLVISQFIGEFEDVLEEELENIEEPVEDALRSLWIEDTADLMGSLLTYRAQPTELTHTDSGLRVVLGASGAAETAPCVQSYVEGKEGSIFTNSNLPPMTSAVPATGQAYDLGAMIGDDFVNQALFAVWQGGAICQVVSDLGGTPLTTSYLGLMLGLDYADRLEALLGGEVPMLIRVAPEQAPRARFDGDHHVEVEATGLGIEFYPLVRDRFARLATVAIDIRAGVDVGLAPDDALQLEITLDTSALNPRVSYNEIAEDLNPAFEENFPGFVTVIIDSVAGSALEGIAFGLPTFLGIGLTSLEGYGLGNSSSLIDWLGLYMGMGETTGGESSGCDGCEDMAGCDTGCGSQGCGDTGCDLEAEMAGAGCSGESSELPDDTGCVGCRIVATRSTTGKWTFTLDKDGLRHQAHRGFRPGPLHIVLGLAPLLFLHRRRRSASERG